MSVHNQINHRQKYLEQKAAGVLPDYTANRHSGKLPTPVLPAAKPTRHPLQREDGTKMTLAERLGLAPPAEDNGADVAPAVSAVLPRSVLPEPTANVADAPAPAVQVDAAADDGDLPPIGAVRAYDPPQGRIFTEEEDADI